MVIVEKVVQCRDEKRDEVNVVNLKARVNEMSPHFTRILFCDCRILGLNACMFYHTRSAPSATSKLSEPGGQHSSGVPHSQVAGVMVV